MHDPPQTPARAGETKRSCCSAQRIALAPQMDDARNDLIQDLLYSQGATKLGFVAGAGHPSERLPLRRTLLTASEP
jgi:hypothetical protein